MAYRYLLAILATLSTTLALLIAARSPQVPGPVAIVTTAPAVTVSSPSDASTRGSWLAQRIARFNLTDAERDFYRLGWYSSLREAVAEAARTQRLVLLVSASGDLCSGRL